MSATYIQHDDKVLVYRLHVHSTLKKTREKHVTLSIGLYMLHAELNCANVLYMFSVYG